MKLKENLISLFSSGGKELKTVWKVEKDGKVGFLAGTAHFFPYRFQKSLQSYIQSARVIIFEGPLDQKGMDQVVERGSQEGGAANLYGALDAQTIEKIKSHLDQFLAESRSISSFFPFPVQSLDPVVVYFQNSRPWMAFFRIWTHFLRERGWKFSVDLEALKIATRLGKEIVFLETIEEQIAALEGIPLERFIHFFKRIDQWEELAKANVRLYLQGELKTLLACTEGFPSRCPCIVERRDPVMFSRMKKFFENGEATAFIGTPHIPGILSRFEGEGYAIRQVGKGEG